MKLNRVASFVAVVVALSAGSGARAGEPRCLGESALHRAVAAKDAVEVVRLLALEPELQTSVDALGDVPLHLAAREGQLNIVRLLARDAPSEVLEARDPWGGTPLLRAVWAGQDAAARALIAVRARPTVRTNDGTTLLHAAARRGMAGLVPVIAGLLGASGPVGANDVIEVLTPRTPAERDANVRAWVELEDDFGLRPIDYAVLAGSRATVDALRRLGAEVQPSTLALGCGLARVELVRGLARELRTQREPDGRRKRPLGAAMRMALTPSEPLSRIDASTVACLVDAGARVRTDTLRLALDARRSDIAAFLLLRAGAGFGADRGDPMLHVVAVRQEVALLELLIALGAPLEAVDPEGASALQRAVLADAGLSVERLLAAGADAKGLFQGADARALALRHGATRALTALAARLGHDVWTAAALGELDALKAILDKDPAAALRLDDDGLAPAHVAARFGQLEALKVLAAAGVKLDTAVASDVHLGDADVSGWTPLHFAAGFKHAHVYRWLLEIGVIDRTASDGTLAWDLARGMTEVAAGMVPDWNESEDKAHDAASEQGLGSGGGGIGHSSNGIGSPIIVASPRQRGGGPSSFIGLGGGILRDERRIDEELVPARVLVGTPPDEAIPAWSDTLASCLRSGQWPEAERLARALVAERSGVPLPASLIGSGWHEHALLLASARQTLARVLVDRGRTGEAEALFEAASGALALVDRGDGAQLLPVHRLLAAIATGRARLHMRLGQLDAAEADLGAGLAALAGSVLEPLRACLLGRLGLVLGEAARYAEALSSVRRALAIVETSAYLDELPSPHLLRHNLGTLLGRVGERDEARRIAFEELARVERDEVELVEDRALIRYTAGLWRLVDGASDEGLALIARARNELAAVHPRHPALGRFDLGAGLALTRLGRATEADDALTRGLAALLASEDAKDVDMLTPPSAADFARILGARATLARTAGRLDEARALAREAYMIVVATQALEARWPLELELARIAAARELQPVAIFYGKRAVRTLDRIRGAGLPEAAARAFIDDRIDVWRELADQLVKAGRFVEATAALEAIKDDEEEAFATTRGKKRRADASAKEQAQEQESMALPEVGAEKKADAPEKPLKAAQREVDKLADKERRGEAEPFLKQRLLDARALLRERRRAFEAWLQGLEGELMSMPPARAQAIAAMNLRDLASLQDTLGTLGQGVVMVHYLVTEDRVRAIVTTSDSQVGREAPIKGSELNTLVFQFRQVLTDPKRDARTAAHALYQVLVAPIEKDLADAKATTLLVSLDGALRYAPLAALWDGQGWLVERFDVVHFARAALHHIMDARPKEESLAAFGCGRAVPGFQRLDAVPAELESIVKRDASDPDGELPGVVQLDDAFSRESLTSVLEAKRFNAVHIASHFVLGPGGEGESYLLLGDGQRLTLEDIRFDLRFDGVDLLSLSACNTAVGDAGNDGREIEGFASLALRLGARAVLATLWPVSDASTGLFMRTLYRAMKNDPTRSRSAVLRATMLAFIRGEVALDGGTRVAAGPGGDDGARGPRPMTLIGSGGGGGGGGSAGSTEPMGAAGTNPGTRADAPIDLRHPRYWAPFVFIGNWR